MIKIYNCHASFQHDNENFALEEIRLQIHNAIKEMDCKLLSLQCVSSEKARGDAIFRDDYIFEFDYQLQVNDPDNIDINNMLDAVDNSFIKSVIPMRVRDLFQQKKALRLMTPVGYVQLSASQINTILTHNISKFYAHAGCVGAAMKLDIVELFDYELIKEEFHSDSDTNEYLVGYCCQ